jgi:hypothetical protein
MTTTYVATRDSRREEQIIVKPSMELIKHLGGNHTAQKIEIGTRHVNTCCLNCCACTLGTAGRELRLDRIPGLVEEDVARLGGLLNVRCQAVEIFYCGRIYTKAVSSTGSVQTGVYVLV